MRELRKSYPPPGHPAEPGHPRSQHGRPHREAGRDEREVRGALKKKTFSFFFYKKKRFFFSQLESQAAFGALNAKLEKLETKPDV